MHAHIGLFGAIFVDCNSRVEGDIAAPVAHPVSVTPLPVGASEKAAAERQASCAFAHLLRAPHPPDDWRLRNEIAFN